MEIIESMIDSVETSVNGLKLFSSEKESAHAHIFKSSFGKVSISQCRDMDNFNPARLSSDPYPKTDRPRGQSDLDSVTYNRNYIREHGHTIPIWIAIKKGRYILLDGAHRIVSTYLEKKRSIPAYIVKVD
jgi:hypothetical protein